MEERENLLAYCGFYCGECLGNTGVIADAAADFKTILDDFQFDRSAKSIFPDQLHDYERFYEIVGFMTGLKCPMICRERKDSDVDCEVRNCCIDNNFFACYECDDFSSCDKLKSLMNGLHYESSLKNFKAIGEMGLAEWISKGKKHHYWDKVTD